MVGGYGAISINWTTGAAEIYFLRYQLFGAGAFASSEHAPWIITTSLPLGIMLFWYYRLRGEDLDSGSRNGLRNDNKASQESEADKDDNHTDMS